MEGLILFIFKSLGIIYASSVLILTTLFILWDKDFRADYTLDRIFRKTFSYESVRLFVILMPIVNTYLLFEATRRTLTK
jgi:hypothetical protein